MIKHTHSIAVFVNDLDQAIRFYRDDLGLPIHSQGSFGAEFLEEPPFLGVHPAVHPDAKALVGRHTGVTFFVEGLLHFCGELHAKGVNFIREPTQMSWGIMAMITDPEGNAFALWEDEMPNSSAGSPDAGAGDPR